MFYSRDLIDEVKRKTNLLELVSEQVEVTRVNDKLWSARCPHPDHEDRTPSFRICQDEDGTWSWYCGGCHVGQKDLKRGNYGSDCYAFLSWMSDYKGSPHKISWYESVQILAKRAGIQLEADKNSKMYELLYRMARKKHSDLLKDKNALDYLHSRGLKNETIQDWLIGISVRKEAGEEVKRVSFPLFSKYLEVQGESSRAINWSENCRYPKYINSSNSQIFHKGNYLYGIHKFNSNFPELRITEGQIDVILAHQAGAHNFVATLGTAFTREHVEIIRTLNVTPCFCMDNDPAGKKAVKRAIGMLTDIGVYARVCEMPVGKDLADTALEYGEKLEKYIREHSMNYWEYVLKEPLESYNSQVTDLRKKVLPNILQAREGVANKEDFILMKSYVKEKFGVEL